MTIRVWSAIVASVVVAAAVGCGDHELEPPDRAARVAAAEEIYGSDLFDTIRWSDERTRAREGNAVYAAKCRNCHGPLGSGDTEYARERGLEVPSLVAPDWAHAESIDSVRRRIFVGHEDGMPTWGVAGITPREIDGAAFYLLEVLRPEMLGG